MGLTNLAVHCKIVFRLPINKNSFFRSADSFFFRTLLHSLRYLSSAIPQFQELSQLHRLRSFIKIDRRATISIAL